MFVLHTKKGFALPGNHNRLENYMYERLSKQYTITGNNNAEPNI